MATGLGVALVIGAVGPATVGAQTMPAVPSPAPAAMGCVAMADLAPCISAAKSGLPVTSAPGVLSGARNVKIDRDVDTRQTPATVTYDFE
ncbi:MAG: hypothetical protein IT337_16185 [Thermomicrobiales bacterium]|nr:hypothetical protein [Thermomicrobiales bacterium]